MLKLQQVEIEKLKLAPYNPRKMPDDQMRLLMKGIQEFGVVDPIVANKQTGNIVGGHQRVEACKRLGLSSVPVVWVDLDDTREKALNLALNKISGEWDQAKLHSLLEEFDFNSFDIDLTGFSLDEISLTKLEPTKPKADPNEIPEPPKEPITKPGDRIKLGRHVLLCGDSRVLSDVERLMDGVKADMVFTDPPYNVAYEGKTKDALTIENDSMGDADFYQFLLDVYTNLLLVTKPGGGIYVCFADVEVINFAKALVDAGWKYAQMCIWLKNTMVMGRKDYHFKHEPILYGWHPGAAHRWHSDRKQTTIWEFDKPQRNGEHPTMKPVELVQYAIGNSSMPGEVVLDLFGGSGTTLIAAELTGRTAYLCELSPTYADVIVNRWEQVTGLKAERPS